MMQDFRAPLDVPSDHPTYEQELALRRRRILALNRTMKAREDALWMMYARHARLLCCVDRRHEQSSRLAFRWFIAAVLRFPAEELSRLGKAEPIQTS